MFNNLIESNSHTREFKRRGSFFLFTVGAYALLFVVAGVVSIYAYDAHLDEQSTELTMLVFAPPEPVAEVKPTLPVRNNPPTANENPHATVPMSPVLYESASNPHSTPDVITTTAQPIPAARPGTVLGPYVSNPVSSGGPGVEVPGGNGNRVAVEIETPPPPPPVTQRPVPQVVRKNVINGEAIELPKPPYPPIAKQAGISGTVNVQVLIDESGKVVSAHAVSGSPLLSPEAVRAAYRARFSPTRIGDQPVKVSGVITYNFVLN